MEPTDVFTHPAFSSVPGNLWYSTTHYEAVTSKGAPAPVSVSCREFLVSLGIIAAGVLLLNLFLKFLDKKIR